MPQQLLAPSRVIRTLRKTPVILSSILADITEEGARTLHDGLDGWSILFIVCHLRDYEDVVAQRVSVILTEDRPVLPGIDNVQLPVQNRYGEQNLRDTLADLMARRAALLATLEELTDAQWARVGQHPSYGFGTLLDVATNVCLHDVDHIEQIVRCIDEAA